jgi:hydrogenase nickel incorporation protein HypB
MCDTCGCNITHGNERLIKRGGKFSVTESGHEAVEVLQNLLHENDHTAAHNREHFDRHGVLAINLMSSPGAGKTSLLEATVDSLAGSYRCAVVEGDLETENDADRIRAHGVPAVQITTGSACHLDAHMVHDALHQLNLDDIDILFIENVGNLVCPASFDLGQHLNVTLLSVPEGDDKPAKYPVMFRASDLVLLSKSDLLPYLDDFDPERAEGYVRRLASAVPVLRLSCKQKDTMTAWLDWLVEQSGIHKERVARGETRQPEIQPDGEHLHAHEHGAGSHE